MRIIRANLHERSKRRVDYLALGSAALTHTFFPFENRLAVERHTWKNSSLEKKKSFVHQQWQIPSDFTRDCVSQDVSKWGYGVTVTSQNLKSSLKLTKLLFIFIWWKCYYFPDSNSSIKGLDQCTMYPLKYVSASRQSRILSKFPPRSVTHDFQLCYRCHTIFEGKERVCMGCCGHVVIKPNADTNVLVFVVCLTHAWLWKTTIRKCRTTGVYKRACASHTTTTKTASNNRVCIGLKVLVHRKTTICSCYI